MQKKKLARRRKCVYLKNPDETYIRLDPVNETTTLESNSNNDDDNKIYAENKPDTLFASNYENGTSSPQQPANRPDKMIEQLTDGLVRLTLHHDPSKLGTEAITPWHSYGEFIRWTPEPHLPTYYTAPIDMPTRSTQENLIRIFFDECHATLPILSKSMFYDQLTVKGPLITPLLLNVMYAHASKHIKDPTFRSDPNDPTTQGDLFYHRARRLIDDFLDVPRVSTVIALLYLAVYDHIPEKGRSSRGWMYSGMAIRMCFELGLHTANYSSQMSQCDIEIRKRVLWTCYVMDKLESCTMERPWMIKSKDIALDFSASLPEDSARDRLLLESFNQLCRLMILVEKVIHFFTYDMKNLNLWTISEENQILQYLDAIYQWREMLPNELQWRSTSNMPSSAAMANLHLLCYDLELSLLMCCRYQDESLHRERRRALADTITHIVSLTVQHSQLMYSFALSTFSGIFAALTHAVDFNNPRMDIAEGATLQFRKSLEDIRLTIERIPMRDLRNFSRLVDLTLQPNQQDFSYTLISDLVHNKEEHMLSQPPHDILENHSGYVTPERVGSPFQSNPMISGQFAFDVTYQNQARTAASSPAGSVSNLAVNASTSTQTNKSIEPADYTFELISVADEWARSLIY